MAATAIEPERVRVRAVTRARNDRLAAQEWVPVGALLVGCVVTVLSFETSLVPFAYQLPRMHAVLDTVIGVVSLLLAFLIYGRLRAFRRQRDFGLAFALAFGGLVSLFGAISQGVSTAAPDRFSTWAPTAGRVLVALLFVVAAVTPDRPFRRPARVAIFGSVVALSFVGLVVVVGVFSAHLPWSHDLTASPRDVAKPVLVGPGLLIAALAFVAVAYGIAAIGFSRRRAGDGDLMTWIAASAILFSLASLNYLAFPSIYSDWIYVGDFLRLAAVLLLLVGAAREISGYWAKAAAMEERRKLAHDLHDGVAQELVYIAAAARRADGDLAERIADAAQHALDESRLVIATLAGAGDPVEQLTLTARDAAHRYGLDLVLDIQGADRLSAQRTESLLRVLREAINNAGRHAGATTVNVTLAVGDAIELRVADDGRGFDPKIVKGGFGLVSMSERAVAMGGTCAVTSDPVEGTTVTTTVPL